MYYQAAAWGVSHFLLPVLLAVDILRLGYGTADAASKKSEQAQAPSQALTRQVSVDNQVATIASSEADPEAARESASTTPTFGSTGALCQYRCLRDVICFTDTPTCFSQVFIAGNYYCQYFKGCPPGKSNKSPIYEPYAPGPL